MDDTAGGHEYFAEIICCFFYPKSCASLYTLVTIFLFTGNQEDAVAAKCDQVTRLSKPTAAETDPVVLP